MDSPLLLSVLMTGGYPLHDIVLKLLICLLLQDFPTIVFSFFFLCL